jgi:hypothetical protein
MRFTSISPADVVLDTYSNRSIRVEPLHFQIPRMYMPFGVSGFTPPYGQTKYNVDFSMKGWDQSEGGYVNKFYVFLQMIENKVIDHVETLSESIFGNKMTREQLLAVFNSNIKFSPNHDPKFRVKVSDKTQFFDVNDAELTGELSEGLYKRYSGAAFVQFGNIYFFNKRFGITWTIEQMKIYEPQRLHGFSFSEQDGDNGEDGEDGEGEPVAKLIGCQFKV